jgi:hypothetical protein
MERIRISNNKNFVKLIFGFVFLCFVFGFGTSIYILVRGSEPNVEGDDWYFLTAIFQGAMAILFGLLFFKRERYFFEWDATTVRYFMPSDNQQETIAIADIKSVTVRKYEIELTLKNSVKLINIKNLKPEQMQRVRQQLEAIGQQCKKVE